MIVYRPQERTACLSHELGEIRHSLETPGHGVIRDALIHLGEIESGLADHLAPDVDHDSHSARIFRRAITAVAHLFCRSWQRQPCSPWLNPCLAAIAEAAALPLPARVVASVPEGYAYYGLFPEMYINAAEQFWRALRPREVVVIGIRSIGASLSAVVAAHLAGFGCDVRSYTVRPRGHPFDRVIRISHALRSEWATCASALFAIVDEGPGLSGSSFASVAKLLESIGVPDEQIILFPSWNADPDSFRNEAARARWSRYRKFIGSFSHPADSNSIDFSAGKWRDALYKSPTQYPAVQPQHERRKYLAEPNLLLKFAGLGRYGEHKLAIARDLADAGFSPRPRSFSDGFLAAEFVTGRPLSSSDISPDLLDHIASYLAFRKRQLPADRSVNFEQMLEMIEVNQPPDSCLLPPASLSPQPRGAGPWPAAASQAALRSEFNDRPAVAVDGRMLSHEWLRTDRGFLKADATDHHADHFYPGGADILWDIAGCAVEFQLGSAERDRLFQRYCAASGDRPSRGLLAFYEIAYLAFRLGYSTLAAQATSGTPDGERFDALELGYQRLLRDRQSSLVPVSLS
jgi:hypothetical protein